MIATVADREREKAVLAIEWVLRFALLIQAVGVGSKYFLIEYEQDTSLFAVLVFEEGWNELAVQILDEAGAVVTLAAGLILFFVPLFATITGLDLSRKLPSIYWQTPLLLLIFAWQLLITWAAWQREEPFLYRVEFLSEASRYLLPIAILMLMPTGSGAIASASRFRAAAWVLRAAVAATFWGHGFKSLWGNPRFVDYLLVAANKLLSWDFPQGAAEVTLVIIGLFDVILAGLVLLTRWRWVPVYMACWAYIATLARVIEKGWGAHYDLTIRAANYCIPAAVFLYFLWCHRQRNKRASNPQESTDDL